MDLYKVLEAACVEITSLKKHVVPTDTRKAGSENIDDEVRENLKKGTVRFSVAPFDPDLVKKLKHFSENKSENAIHAVVQPLWHDAVSRLQQVPELAYWAVRVSCLVALTRTSEAPASRICWKDEVKGDDGGC